MQRQMSILLIVDDKGQKYFAFLFPFKSHDNDDTLAYFSYPRRNNTI